jgi:hypothetical protein
MHGSTKNQINWQKMEKIVPGTNFNLAPILKPTKKRPAQKGF